MKLRLAKTASAVCLLCADGTICNASPRLVVLFVDRFNTPEEFTGTNGTWSTLCADMEQYPGETLAYVTDDLRLVIESPWVTEIVEDHLRQSISFIEYARRHNRSPLVIMALVRDGLIPEAYMFGEQLFIPADTPYPIEERSRKPK